MSRLSMESLTIVARQLPQLFAIILVLILGSSNAKAGAIGGDNRHPIDEYATSHSMSPDEARKKFGATGRIMCPFGEASAFLIFKSNIVVTARHVLFPEASMGGYAGRMSISRCGFEVSDGKGSKWHKVDVRSFLYPDAKQRSLTDRFDWVVMRLSEPVTEFEPYHMPSKPVSAGDKITMATIRQDNFLPDDWNERILTDCRIRAIDNIDGVAASGIRTDCSSGHGASGGALLRQGPEGLEAVGIMSSMSGSCTKFNRTRCYTFAVGFEPELVAAVHKLAGE